MGSKMKTYNKVEDAKVEGRGGAFVKIREEVATLIPKGQVALMGDVIKHLTIDIADAQKKYNYVRNACKNWIVRHNGRVFIKVPQ